MTKVAIQGYRGCFHEQAAREFYSARGEEISIVECPTFEGLFRAVADGEAQAAVMAIENTISGGLIPNFELLRSNPYRIKGEVYIPIHQNLMALPGQDIRQIKEVRTHYMAINQTRQFFERNCPWIKMVESEDTAKSAIDISAGWRESVRSLRSWPLSRTGCGSLPAASRPTSRTSPASWFWTTPSRFPAARSTRLPSASPCRTSQARWRRC